MQENSFESWDNNDIADRDELGPYWGRKIKKYDTTGKYSSNNPYAKEIRQCQHCENNDDGYCIKYKCTSIGAIDRCNEAIFYNGGKTCPSCGGELIERSGPYGSFYGCKNFPKCKFVKK